jgi:hypothetical protein
MHPLELPPGCTRIEAREDCRRMLEGERVDGRSQRAINQFGDIDHQLKKARVVGMKAQAEKIVAIDTIQTKIQLLRENADVYRSVHKEQCYNEMLVALINKMTGMGEESTSETPMSAVYTQSQQSGEDKIH